MIRVVAEDEEAERLAWQVYDSLAVQQSLRTTTSDGGGEGRGGHLSLNGRGRNTLMRSWADRQAKGAMNGWQLRNNRISDESLALKLASRLAADPRTATADVRLEVFLGTVYIKGVAHSAQQRDAVRELIAAEPSVRGVEGSLAIRSR